MKRFRARPEAADDLAEIADYLSRQASAATAKRIVRRLRDRCRLLAEYPHAGPNRPELGDGLRTLSEHPYVIVYQVAADGVAEIISFLHGARDLPATIAKRIKSEI